MMIFYRKIVRTSNYKKHISCTKFARNMQILERILNNFLVYKITPLILVVGPYSQIFGIYTCIKFNSKFPFYVFMMFALICINAIVCNIVLFTFASWIQVQSQEAIVLWEKQCCKYKRRSLLKKMIKTFVPLKIKFGSNFMDRGTALVIQNYVFNQTMSLLLIKIN
jgi:hypothetical protein